MRSDHSIPSLQSPLSPDISTHERLFYILSDNEAGIQLIHRHHYHEHHNMFSVRLTRPTAAHAQQHLLTLRRTIYTTPRLLLAQAPPPPPSSPSDSNPDGLASAASEMMSTFAQSPLYNVIKSRPGAIEAIKTVGDLMQKKGTFRFRFRFLLRPPT